MTPWDFTFGPDGRHFRFGDELIAVQQNATDWVVQWKVIQPSAAAMAVATGFICKAERDTHDSDLITSAIDEVLNLNSYKRIALAGVALAVDMERIKDRIEEEKYRL